METKANHLVIGGFVLGTLVLVLGFVFWMNNFIGGGEKRYAILFEGSVNGLGTGSNVLFNGLRIGKVESLSLDMEDTRRVRVVIGVDPRTPVRTNSRASIQSMGLTGGSAVQIGPGSPEAPMLVADASDALPLIKADRATSGSLFEAGPEVLGNANALLTRLNDLVANNEDSIHRTMSNLESVSAMLDEKKADIGQTITDARELTTRFKGIADKVDQTVEKFQGYLTNDGTSFLAQAQEAAMSFRRLADKLEKSFGDNADSLTRFAKNGMSEFEQFMKDGRRAANTLDRVLVRFDNNPRGFLFGGTTVPEYSPGR